LVENRRSEPTPPLFGDTVVGERWNFAEIFSIRKLESLGYHLALFARSHV